MTDYTRQYNALQALSDIASLKPVILDTETTGLDESARIVEIAAIDYETGKTLYATRVNPEIDIPAAATNVHGITNEMVADAPKWPVVAFALLDVLQDRPIAAYNADYDKRLVEQCNAANGLPNMPNRWFDVMLPYAEFYGQWSEYHGNYSWQKLTAAVDQMGLKVDRPGLDPHSAEWDAYATFLLLREMTARFQGLHEYKATDINALVSSLGTARKALEDAKARKAALVAKFEASPAFLEATREIALTETAEAVASAKLKVMAEKYYLGTLDKTPHEAAKVAVTGELVYSEADAIDYCKQNNLPDGLKLNTREFEKYARRLDGTLGALKFVKIEQRLQVRLATDMSKYIQPVKAAPKPELNLNDVMEIPF